MVRQHSMELQARYLWQVGCCSLVHDGKRRSIGPAQALDHAMDARDMIVAGAHELKKALHWILSQDAGTYEQRHPAEGMPDVGIKRSGNRGGAHSAALLGFPLMHPIA